MELETSPLGITWHEFAKILSSKTLVSAYSNLAINGPYVLAKRAMEDEIVYRFCELNKD